MDPLSALFTVINGISNSLATVNSSRQMEDARVRSALVGLGERVRSVSSLIQSSSLKWNAEAGESMMDVLKEVQAFVNNAEASKLHRLDSRDKELLIETVGRLNDSIIMASAVYSAASSGAPKLQSIFNAVGGNQLVDIRSELDAIFSERSGAGRMEAAKSLLRSARVRSINLSQLNIGPTIAGQAVGGALNKVTKKNCPGQTFIMKKPILASLELEVFMTVASMRMNRLLYFKPDHVSGWVDSVVIDGNELVGFLMLEATGIEVRDQALPATDEDPVACSIVRALLASIVTCWCLERVHSDPKIENVLAFRVKGNWFSVLADWGMVQKIGDTRVKMGTQGHLLQDHFKGQKVTLKSYMIQILRILTGQARSGAQQCTGSNWVAMVQHFPQEAYASSLLNRLVEVVNTGPPEDNQAVIHSVEAIHSWLTSNAPVPIPN